MISAQSCEYPTRTHKHTCTPPVSYLTHGILIELINLGEQLNRITLCKYSSQALPCFPTHSQSGGSKMHMGQINIYTQSRQMAARACHRNETVAPCSREKRENI